MKGIDLADNMIGRKNADDGILNLVKDFKNRQQDSRSGIPATGLADYFSFGGDADLLEVTRDFMGVFTAAHKPDFIPFQRRHQPFDSCLHQGEVAGKFDQLLGIKLP